MKLYRIEHSECGKEWYCVLEDARKWKCPVCKKPLDNMKTATVGLEFVEGEDLV